MAASYPGSIKIFSTKESGQAIASNHINDLQNEVVAVETQLGTNAGTWQDWTPTVTWETSDGSTTDPTSVTITSARYTTVGKLVTLYLNLTIVRGSGDRKLVRFTLPVNAKTNGICFNAQHTMTSSGYGIFGASRTVTSSQTGYVQFGGAMTTDGSVFVSGSYEAS